MVRRPAEPRTIGRYEIHERIASGGMATVFLGRLKGPVGFSRPVAIKRLHPAFTEEPELVTMLIDEARIASRVLHPNVVSVLDVVTDDGEVFLVMEYVHGVSLSRLLKASNDPVPAAVAASIVCGTLYGLHAVLTDEDVLR